MQLRVNGVNLTSGAGAPTYGFYVCNEFLDSDFADHHFPLDSSGNLYRGQRFVTGRLRAARTSMARISK